MGVTTEMRSAIYSPYWNTLGGGEYYAGSVAKALEDAGHEVDIFSPNSDTVIRLNERFNLELKFAKVNQLAFKKLTQSIFSKWMVSKPYDVLFMVSDGSVPFMFAKKNILHFQVPFKNIGGSSVANQIKMKTIDYIVANSKFTKSIVDQEYRCESVVIYPAVKPIPAGEKKQNLILSVGRFDGNQKGKRQDVLIQAFQKLKMDGWTLALAGGVVDENCEFLESLKKSARGLPITFHVNCSYEELKKLYQKSRIYWHAHGYGTNAETQPESTEHFGISVVEALSAGSIPVVYRGGGLLEIVGHSDEFTWVSVDELVSNTKNAFKKSSDKIFINKCRQKSQQFSKEVFDESVKKILS